MSQVQELPVLDKGFVRLVDRMGGDESVVRAARVSHGSSAKTPEDDRKLIHYLLVNKHGTPFEHTAMTFHVKAPIFVARQWFRHRIGQSFNEVSMRYREARDEFYFPEKWRAKAGKQGSVAADLDHQALHAELAAGCESAMGRYRTALALGAAPEMARMHLPVNLYTEWYWTVNARSLMSFMELRSEQHAQWEIRQYSNTLWQIFAWAMPATAEAFLSTIPLSKYQSLDLGGVAGPNIDAVRSSL